MKHFESSKRLILKIGSSLLTDETGELRREWLASLAQDIAQLHQQGTEILIVSSGAVALGRTILQAEAHKPNHKQAASACGQPLLMQAWQQVLAAHDLASAQILLTLNDTESRSAYLNARNTIRALLERTIIPIINENDSVTTHGILYGDNDRLAARIAAMVDGDRLLLLSDVDGLYTANPQSDDRAELIEEVAEITPEIQAMAGGAGAVGSGGMVTKLDAAMIATRAGCVTLIANGQRNFPLSQLEQHTRFEAHAKPLLARQRWISGSIQPAGKVTIDSGAVEALHQGRSLLHVGVVALEGNFLEGDTLEVVSPQGELLAKGLASVEARIANALKGKRSEKIIEILGYEAPHELIHRDHLVLLLKSGS